MHTTDLSENLFRIPRKENDLSGYNEEIIDDDTAMVEVSYPTIDVVKQRELREITHSLGGYLSELDFLRIMQIYAEVITRLGLEEK